jgi:hypothetical protein
MINSSSLIFSYSIRSSDDCVNSVVLESNVDAIEMKGETSAESLPKPAQKAQPSLPAKGRKRLTARMSTMGGKKVCIYCFS